MTLHGDRVTCDVPGCGADWATWVLRPHSVDTARSGRIRIVAHVCPACRARYTDKELRDLLARGETPREETT